MRKLAHIINPVKVPPTSDLFTAQPITFETMRLAKEAAKDLEIEQFTTQYSEDHEIIPEYFKKLENLERSVVDIRQFSKKRKLPLIKDILDKLYQNSDAEYLIFTNADIALMPQFYMAINQFIDQGHDALIINRRRISKNYTRVSDIPLMFSEIGRPHPGFDCFVFHRDLYSKFLLGNICVGIQFIGVSLAHNIFAHAKNFKLLDDQHLTFHIGMIVMTNRDKEYYWHNRREFNKIYKQLKPHLELKKLPYAALPFYKRWLKWGMNPSISIKMAMEFEGVSWTKKIKYYLDEIRFRIVGGR